MHMEVGMGMRGVRGDDEEGGGRKRVKGWSGEGRVLGEMLLTQTHSKTTTTKKNYLKTKNKISITKQIISTETQTQEGKKYKHSNLTFTHTQKKKMGRRKKKLCERKIK